MSIRRAATLSLLLAMGLNFRLIRAGEEEKKKELLDAAKSI